MKHSKRAGLSALVAALTLAFAGTSAGAEDFSITYRWCSGSPEITLKGVPKGTVTLDATMTDLWVPSYDHGGGRIPYKGQKSIPCGAMTNFRGPAPPPPQVHEYQWKVKAVDANGSVLGTAEATRKFPEH